MVPLFTARGGIRACGTGTTEHIVKKQAAKRPASSVAAYAADKRWRVETGGIIAPEH